MHFEVWGKAFLVWSVRFALSMQRGAGCNVVWSSPALEHERHRVLCSMYDGVVWCHVGRSEVYRERRGVQRDVSAVYTESDVVCVAVPRVCTELPSVPSWCAVGEPWCCVLSCCARAAV